MSVKPRVFLLSDADGVYCYCGDVDQPEDALRGVQAQVEAEFHGMIESGEPVDLELRIVEMSDAQLAAIPEL